MENGMRRVRLTPSFCLTVRAWGIDDFLFFLFYGWREWYSHAISSAEVNTGSAGRLMYDMKSGFAFASWLSRLVVSVGKA